MEEASARFRLAGGRLSGCYLLRWQGVVVFVGKSENVFGRVNVHWMALARAKQGLRVENTLIAQEKVVEFDEVEFFPVRMQDLDAEEHRLVQFYQPKHNKQLNRESIAPGFEKTPAFREFLEKKQEPIAKSRLGSRLPSGSRRVQADV